MKALCTVALAAACAGCSPLWAVSSAPPTTKGELHLGTDQIELTQGVALAISCRDIWWGGPCENLQISSDDPRIATVAFVHLDKYRNPGGFVYDQHHPRSAFLVAGVAPGRTFVRIGGDDADEVLEVVVRE
jgi:hypothetical protein